MLDCRKKIAIVENGYVYVDFLLSSSKNSYGTRIGRTARNIGQSLLDGGSKQAKNNVPPKTFRLVTPFSNKRRLVRFLKTKFGTKVIRHVQISR
ncbi:MAG: hypothetical protein A2214_01730 [Candidatus Harrisonbacteria bacterium RIFOXYA1_FULL_48_8]|uniref:Uncharacterized protein n=2 Tax=Candidatus Harrisoniibacteriota TaxID=1817905 RepID=A0A1G1ZY17_9BACT|nr:MAG: hypothetical protein UY30_C0009G0007 [Parcubacteria group bacterium GW2011_GWB1_48_6]OGY63330.1 MAG: hypothetical protein A3E64_02035 [Candidatus Harrisonbacteria bacterium RIFCSPHIGHO2_12_FULL_48_16]OGY68690.1 MAG: hypothetical protein A2214_01730 [Candidatus Harrisonbacteria bacterium RIFOXYA1_FULL_48_8]